MVKDSRTLRKTSSDGIYRRCSKGCPPDACKCTGGPYTVRWKAGTKSLKRSFATFDLAKDHKDKLGAGTRSRKPQTKATVAEYFEMWLPSYRGRTSKGLDDATREEYARSFRLHILPLTIARIRMRDLDGRDVNDWLVEVEQRGASPWTIRNAKAALRAMIATAVQFDGIERNVVIGVRYVPTQKAKDAHPIRKHRQLSADDITRIMGALPEEWRAFFMLQAQCGLRISEQLGLTWGHVHLGDDPHLVIVEQFRRGKRKQLKTETSKGEVPLSSGMASWLSKLRPVDVDPAAPVFPSKTGTPLQYGNVLRRVLHPALKSVGLDGQGIGFHAFRRACASLLHDTGDHSDAQIQGWLRHAQLSTTQNSYIKPVNGLGSAKLWDTIFPTATSI